MIYCTWADLPPSLALSPSNRSLSRQTALQWTNRHQFNRSTDWRGIWSNYVNVSRRHCPQRLDGRTARARQRTPPEGGRGRMYTTTRRRRGGRAWKQPTLKFATRELRRCLAKSAAVCLSFLNGFPGSLVASLQLGRHFLTSPSGNVFGPF